jgi:hypothetical protein
MSTARWINVLLGAWLFISAFLWPHAPGQFANTWVVGLMVVVLSLIAAGGYSWARYLNAVAAVWLFFATLFMPRMSVGTLWNNCLVAIVVFVVAMTPGRFGSRIAPAHPRS